MNHSKIISAMEQQLQQTYPLKNQNQTNKIEPNLETMKIRTVGPV